jgi:hypothetical protein
MLHLAAHIINGLSEQKRRSGQDVQEVWCGEGDGGLLPGSQQQGRTHEQVCSMRKSKTRELIDEGKRIREKDMMERWARCALKTNECFVSSVKKPWSEFKMVRKRGPYCVSDCAKGRCCQCQKDCDEYMKQQDYANIFDNRRTRMMSAKTTPANVGAQCRRQRRQDRLGW